MGSLALENCVAWTGSKGVSSEIANCRVVWGFGLGSCSSIGRRLLLESLNSCPSCVAMSFASWVSGLSSARISGELDGAPNSDLST